MDDDDHGSPSWQTVVVRPCSSTLAHFSVGSSLLSTSVASEKLRGREAHPGERVQLSLLGTRAPVHVDVVHCQGGNGPLIGPSTRVFVLPASAPRLKVKDDEVDSWSTFMNIRRILRGRLEVQGGFIVGVEGPSGSGKTTAITEACASEEIILIRATAIEILNRSPDGDVQSAVDVFRQLAKDLHEIGASVALLFDDVDQLEINRRDTNFSLLLALRRAAEDDGTVVFFTYEQARTLSEHLQNIVEHMVIVTAPSSDRERKLVLETAVVNHSNAAETIMTPDLIKRASGLLPGEIASAVSSSLELGTALDSFRTASQDRAVTKLAATVTQEIENATQAIGLEEAKAAVEEAVLWTRDRAKELANFGVEAPRGVLLYGAAGTGKTTVAKSVAAWVGCGIISLDAATFVRGEVGASEANLEEAFALARAIAPCVIFLDEIDALFEVRGSTNSTASRLVSALALEMAQGDVPVLAATNRPWDIDRALLRVGRFERSVHVPLPSAKARSAMIVNLARELHMDHECTIHFQRYHNTTLSPQI